jgi:hypothetical protein
MKKSFYIFFISFGALAQAVFLPKKSYAFDEISRYALSIEENLAKLCYLQLDSVQPTDLAKEIIKQITPQLKNTLMTQNSLPHSILLVNPVVANLTNRLCGKIEEKVGVKELPSNPYVSNISDYIIGVNQHLGGSIKQAAHQISVGRTDAWTDSLSKIRQQSAFSLSQLTRLPPDAAEKSGNSGALTVNLSLRDRGYFINQSLNDENRARLSESWRPRIWDLVEEAGGVVSFSNSLLEIPTIHVDLNEVAGRLREFAIATQRDRRCLSSLVINETLEREKRNLPENLDHPPYGWSSRILFLAHELSDAQSELLEAERDFRNAVVSLGVSSGQQKIVESYLETQKKRKRIVMAPVSEDETVFKNQYARGCLSKGESFEYWLSSPPDASSLSGELYDGFRFSRAIKMCEFTQDLGHFKSSYLEGSYQITQSDQEDLEKKIDSTQLPLSVPEEIKDGSWKTKEPSTENKLTESNIFFAFLQYITSFADRLFKGSPVANSVPTNQGQGDAVMAGLSEACLRDGASCSSDAGNEASARILEGLADFDKALTSYLLVKLEIAEEALKQGLYREKMDTDLQCSGIDFPDAKQISVKLYIAQQYIPSIVEILRKAKNEREQAHLLRRFAQEKIDNDKVFRFLSKTQNQIRAQDVDKTLKNIRSRANSETR